ncbi:MAG: hypothetical protein E6H63_10390 [Betaproteobacteria bacterium]|nr:MAG: hypothetical protein E6H63_10390 [Betaproteobacteria bacterium]TMH42250.1 MAG: hypothetical protein E6H54_14450 [Betaproteobacteria bacterium]
MSLPLGAARPAVDLKAKVQQIEEQLQLAQQEYPERIALDRVKFALALAKFVRSQLDLDATVEQTIPPGTVRVGRLP